MTANRYPLAAALDVLTKERDRGFVELWNAVPKGEAMSGEAISAIAKNNQGAIVKGIAVLEQQIVTAVGSRWGFRPEIFEHLRELPGADVVGEVARQIVANDFDLGDIASLAPAAVADVLARVLEAVGNANKLQAAIADYGGAVAAIAQVVIASVKMIVEGERDKRMARQGAVAGALDCAPVGYSAVIDDAFADEVLQRVLNGKIRDLFLPECRPNKYDRHLGAHILLGFTCCKTTTTPNTSPVRENKAGHLEDNPNYGDLGGRMIAPVGTGVGNRFQSGFGATRIIDDYGGGPNEWMPDYYGDSNGFGCLPMCPRLRLHRAIIVTAGGRTYEAGDDLSLVASLGEVAWRVLWACGPATYSVDGKEIADAWEGYLGVMRDQIAGNQKGFGTHMAPGHRVCDSWPAHERSAALRWFFERLGVGDPDRAASPEGIYIFTDAAPVREWSRFAELQGALLDTLMIVTVDARNCAKRWRSLVRESQQNWLENDLICTVDLDTIPDPTYRAAVVEAKRRRGAKCLMVGSDVTQRIAATPVSATSGPSLTTFRGGPPTMPLLTTQPRRADVASSSSSSSDGAELLTLLLLLGGLGVGAGLALRKRKR